MKFDFILQDEKSKFHKNPQLTTTYRQKAPRDLCRIRAHPTSGRVSVRARPRPSPRARARVRVRPPRS